MLVAAVVDVAAVAVVVSIVAAASAAASAAIFESVVVFNVIGVDAFRVACLRMIKSV